MKKLLSFFLSIALLSTLSFTAYATEVAPSVPQEHAIPSIPEEISFSHNRIIKGFTRSASNNLRVMNEYENRTKNNGSSLLIGCSHYFL